MASIAGKNRDRGSIFSQETRKRGYWRPRKQKVFFFFLLLRSQNICVSYHVIRQILICIDRIIKE